RHQVPLVRVLPEGFRPAPQGPALEHACGDGAVFRGLHRPRGVSPVALRPSALPGGLRALHRQPPGEPVPAAAVLGARILRPAAPAEAHPDPQPRHRLAVAGGGLPPRSGHGERPRPAAGRHPPGGGRPLAATGQWPLAPRRPGLPEHQPDAVLGAPGAAHPGVRQVPAVRPGRPPPHRICPSRLFLPQAIVLWKKDAYLRPRWLCIRPHSSIGTAPNTITRRRPMTTSVPEDHGTANVIDLFTGRPYSDRFNRRIIRLAPELDGLEMIYSNEANPSRFFTLKVLCWALRADGEVVGLVPWLNGITACPDLQDPLHGHWEGYYDPGIDEVFFEAPIHKVVELESAAE